MSEARRRWLLAGAAAAVLALTAVRGPVVLAAASAVGLAVVAYRLAGTLRPSRPDWSWGSEARSGVAAKSRLAVLADLLDVAQRDPESATRLQQWFRHVDDAKTTASGGTSPSPLDDYLAGPPRRLSLPEVERLLTHLDPY